MGKILIIKNADFSSVSVDQVTPVTPSTLSAPTIFFSALGIVTISAQPSAVIRYTTDGSTPTVNSTVYSQPFSVSSGITVKAIAILNGETSSVAQKTFIDLLENISEVSNDFTNGYKTLTYTTTDRINLVLNGDYTGWANTEKIIIPSEVTKLVGLHTFYDNGSNLVLPAYIFFNANDQIVDFIMPSTQIGTELKQGSKTYYIEDETLIPSGASKVIIQCYCGQDNMHKTGQHVSFE